MGNSRPQQRFFDASAHSWREKVRPLLTGREEIQYNKTMGYSATIIATLNGKKTIYFAEYQGGQAAATAGELCKEFLKTNSIKQNRIDKIACDFFEIVDEEIVSDDVAEIDFDNNRVQFSVLPLEEYISSAEDDSLIDRILASKATMTDSPVEKLHETLKTMKEREFNEKEADELDSAFICCTIEEAASFFP